MSLLKADTIKPVTSSGDLSLQGDSGGSAVDCLNITSAGDINFTGNTDAKIKLPSAGGIYESDGSTAILTESGAAVTLNNATLGSAVTLPAGLVTNFESFENSTRSALSNSGGGGATTAFPNLNWSYDKKQAATTLFVQARITAVGDASGACGIGFDFGDSADIFCGSYTYLAEVTAIMVCHIIIQGVLSGHTTTGSQTLTLKYGFGTGAKPVDVINPTAATDNGELAATTNSTVFVWEVL